MGNLLKKIKWSKVIRWSLGLLEVFLAIPFMGDGVIHSLILGFPILITCHIVIAVLNKKSGRKATGNILGAIANGLSWVPVVGVLLHMLAGIFIIIELLTVPKVKEISGRGLRNRRIY